MPQSPVKPCILGLFFVYLYKFETSFKDIKFLNVNSQLFFSTEFKHPIPVKLELYDLEGGNVDALGEAPLAEPADAAPETTDEAPSDPTQNP